MKKSKLILFKVNGETVEQIEAHLIDVNSLEHFKSAISASYKVPFDEIEIDTEDIEVPEISEGLFVRAFGGLMCNRKNGNPIFVTGIIPAMDIAHDELFHEFLDLITKKEFDKALIFN